jgi:hypothetical protein
VLLGLAAHREIQDHLLLDGEFTPDPIGPGPHDRHVLGSVRERPADVEKSYLVKRGSTLAFWSRKVPCIGCSMIGQRQGPKQPVSKVLPALRTYRRGTSVWADAPARGKIERARRSGARKVFMDHPLERRWPVADPRRVSRDSSRERR